MSGITPMDVVKSGGSVRTADTSFHGNDENFWLEICHDSGNSTPSAEDIMLMELDDALDEKELFGEGDLFDFIQNEDHVAEFNDGSTVQVNTSLNALELNDKDGKTHYKDNKRSNLDDFVSDLRIETESRISRHELGSFLDNWL